MLGQDRDFAAKFPQLPLGVAETPHPPDVEIKPGNKQNENNSPHRAGWLRRYKSITHAPDGIQESGGFAKLFSQAPHMGVDRPGVDHVLIVPDILEQLVARLNAAP